MKLFRRRFIQGITFAGGSLRAFGASPADETKTITYLVKGFTCPTCAVGLDTMLCRQKGVVRSKSTYPEGIVRIAFDPRFVTDGSLRSFIAEMGFRVEEHVSTK